MSRASGKKNSCRCGVGGGVGVGVHTGGITVEVDVRVSATDEPKMWKKILPLPRRQRRQM
jgi:hypothetical protein